MSLLPYNQCMSYTAAVEGLSALGAELAGARRKFELAHMRTLAAALGDPQQHFPSVLIAGTNGKGSTAATLAGILTASGYRTALYTSPHLLRVNERVQIADADGVLRPIDDEAFGRLYARVHDAAETLVRDGALPQMPSFFETLTAIAFLAFAEAGVEMAVLEVGLGGRLDATNIVEPLVSVLTDIALDHMAWLGNTVGEIAREKAGILRQDGVLVTLPQHPEANAAIGEAAVELNVTGVNAAQYLPQRSAREHDGLPDLVPAFGTLLALQPVLAGDHQRRNLALALAAAETLQSRFGFEDITATSVTRGVAGVRWPGRLEHARLPGGAACLLDVAHNPAGIWTLRSYLSRAFDTGTLPSPRTLVFSALADKAIDEMAQILFPLFDDEGDRVLLVQVDSPRATPLERLHELRSISAEGARAAFEVLPDVAAAYDRVRTQPAGCVIVAGSVYLVAEWKQASQATDAADANAGRTMQETE